MATKAQTATSIEFKKHVELALQQEKSKLRSTVEEKACEGKESALVEVFKPSEAHEIVGDMSNTIYNETDEERRWISFRQYGWAERIDPFTSLDTGMNPLIPYAKLAVMAMHRKQDEAILKGMLGENKKGEMGGDVETFPSDNRISGTHGDSFFQTLIGQIIRAKALFRKRHVDVDSEMIYLGVPSEVWASLFALEKATSKDYINTAALQAGKIEAFAGVWFVDIEKVPGDDSFPLGTKLPGLIDAVYEDYKPNDRGVIKPRALKESAKFAKAGVKYILPCWCRSAVVFSQRKGLTVEHSKDPSRWHAPQITVTASFGATRVEPKIILGI